MSKIWPIKADISSRKILIVPMVTNIQQKTHTSNQIKQESVKHAEKNGGVELEKKVNLTMDDWSDEQECLEYQLYALAFKYEGAMTMFYENLPTYMVGIAHGQTGLHEFYQALWDFYDKTHLDPVDPIAFRSWLESETHIYDALGGPGGAAAFIDMTLQLDLSTPESVIKVLKGRYNKRKQLDYTQELQTILAKKGHKSDEEVAQISQLTDQIRSLENDLDYNPLTSVTTANDIAARAEVLMELPEFLTTPFKNLNKCMGYREDGGFFRGAVHAVIAPSGMGKSTFCKSLVNWWADEGYTTLFINYEEVQAHWETVLMTQVLEENVYAHADDWTKNERQDKLKTFRNKMTSWGDRFMVKHDPDTSYFSDLEIWLRDIMGHNSVVPDVVVIDTIQSLIEKGKGQRWGEFEYMMLRLEKLARDMDAVFIITAQQNADAMKEKREVIKQSDTGGSITIQQKSSVTIFITPKLLAGMEESDDHVMQLQIPKNRITGSTFMSDPPLVMYSDERKSYLPFEGVDSAEYTENVLSFNTNELDFGDFN